MGEAKNAVPPYTWSGTRPGIIITANLLPSMLGAGMHGNVRGVGCWCIGWILGLVRCVPHRRNLPVQELEGVVGVGEILHCFEEKEKTKS